MSNIQEAKSILTLNKTIIDKLIFERFSDDVCRIDIKEPIAFQHQINLIIENVYKVSLGIILALESKYNIEIQISGIFELTNESILGQKLITNNAIAILFPYLRSQLTLLTSQPGFEPVILPIMNINTLLNSEH
ncbi:protein-export chaperone SecB [uncultured Bacteroides sp.]|uniref:protein-export chaperone SecB n=1 Tax=uncultured Bacteroides sp. TaxID=162156 RepID=UPI002611FC31|nr:protein-export chaperone SecB [uncultured Bacteroides sp.]